MLLTSSSSGSASFRGPAEHNPGMEQCSGDSGGNCDQVALAAEDLYLRSARHFRQVHGATAADQSGAFFGGGDARQLRHQLSGMDEQRFRASLLNRGGQHFQSVGMFDSK